MTQEDKDLLLRDLSSRLLYKVVAQVSYKDGEGWKTQDRKVLGVYTDEQVYVDGVYTDIENTKPYLRPMSSMTEEEKRTYTSLRAHAAPFTIVNWLDENHFDHRTNTEGEHLIELGIALEAPEGMYN